MSNQPLPFYRDCLVCGTTPTGLNVRFGRAEDGSVCAQDYTFPIAFQGFPGVIHGGAISAVLDENAGWAATLEARDYVATVSLTVQFVRPVKTNTAYKVRGHFTTREEGSVIAESVITDEAGKIYASARGVFRPLPARISNEFEAVVTYPPDASNAWRQLQHPTPPTT